MVFDIDDTFFKGVQGKWFHYGLWEAVPLFYCERNETFLVVTFGLLQGCYKTVSCSDVKT